TSATPPRRVHSRSLGRGLLARRWVPLALACAVVSAAAQALAQAPNEPAPGTGEVAPESDGTAKPVIVPPELLHFEEAVYPPEAFEQGLEAEVLLKLVVNVDGSVGEVEVLEPVGSG